MEKGFTLVETLVYLALYAIIITGAVAGVYSIVESSAHNQTKALVQEEGNFLIGKIDWALANAKTISSPIANRAGATLSVTTYAGTNVTIQVAANAIVITDGVNSAETLNNDNVQASCPGGGCFAHTSKSADGINPESVTATITITTHTDSGLLFSQDFSTVKYLRR